ncbi:MAG: sulfurtransferase TusA family protein [Nitrososphaerota archaeon]|nr:sulfurtransferase TusA family protein [Candidatus Bathyarchaeota archaeon]MDW8024183.1 sulfurtransferase TusA family protein [Nitrososphaerota archaeon]
MKKFVLDARGKMCPWPVLLTNEKLKLMSPGDLLEVVVDYPPAKENVTRTVEGQGHKVLGVIEESGQFKIIIRKGSTEKKV